MIDSSQQVIIDYKTWLHGLIKPRAIKSDPHEQPSQSNKKAVITDDWDE